MTPVYLRAFRQSLAHVSENNLSLIAAGVAFFSMLSLFPALAALIALFGLISDPAVVLAELEEMRSLLPEDVFDIVEAQVLALVNAQNGTLGWAGVVSVLLALWSARAGVSAMIIGLNEVYGLPNRSAVWHYLRALALTVLLVSVGLVALVSLVIVPILLTFFPLGGLSGLVVEILRWLTATVVLFAGVGVLYRMGPNRDVTLPWVTVGSVFAVASWALLSTGFSWYVANFGNYNQVYGSIGAVVAMLVWMWISSFLVLFGAALNVQKERIDGNA
jgi:membrane protein